MVSQKTIDGVGNAEDLERVQAEAVRLIFDEQFAQAQLGCEAGQAMKRCGPQIEARFKETVDIPILVRLEKTERGGRARGRIQPVSRH